MWTSLRLLPMLLVESSVGRLARASSAPAVAAALRPRSLQASLTMSADPATRPAASHRRKSRVPIPEPSPSPLPSETTWSAAARLSVTPPTAEDVRVIEERQLGHRASNMIAVGPRCKHGVPQAFAWDPVSRRVKGESWDTKAGKSCDGGRGKLRMPLDSGLFRLSCPLLVKAIDEWEGEGAVADLNAELGMPVASGTDSAHEPPADPPVASAANPEGGLPPAATQLLAAHQGHAAARLQLLGEERLSELLDALPASTESGRAARLVLQSGITGQLPTKLDVKCLHAQLADHLCRSETNEIGALVLARLEQRGVSVRGDERCRGQCDLCVPPGEAEETFWYTPAKNRWKLRKRLERRRDLKLAEKLKREQAAPPASPSPPPPSPSAAQTQ